MLASKPFKMDIVGIETNKIVFKIIIKTIFTYHLCSFPFEGTFLNGTPDIDYDEPCQQYNVQYQPDICNQIFMQKYNKKKKNKENYFFNSFKINYNYTLKKPMHIHTHIYIHIHMHTYIQSFIHTITHLFMLSFVLPAASDWQCECEN